MQPNPLPRPTKTQGFGTEHPQWDGYTEGMVPSYKSLRDTVKRVDELDNVMAIFHLVWGSVSGAKDPQPQLII